MRKIMRRAIALVLALIMLMAISVVTSAANATVSVEKTDAGTYVATINIASGIESFDYGVTYDSTKLAVKSTNWNIDFSIAYVAVSGIMSKNDQTGYDYVVFGGTSNGPADYTGAIATVEFEVVEGAEITNRDVITLVENSKALKNKIDATGTVAPIRTADGYSPISTAKLVEVDATVSVVKNVEGNYVATISVGTGIESFDYGVTYDSSKLAVKSTNWDAGFSVAYIAASGIMSKSDQVGYDYVVFGGTADHTADYTGPIATVEFTVVDGAEITERDVITLVENSKALKNQIDATGKVSSIRTAAGYAPISRAKLVPIDATVTVTKNAEGNYVASISIGSGIESFDLGVTYDSSKLAVKNTAWNIDFLGEYMNVSGITAKSDQIGYDYVVFGGTANTTANYTGEIATVEFTVVDGAEITAEDVITLVDDSKYLKTEVDRTGTVASIRTAASYAPISVAKLIDDVIPTEVPTAEPTTAPETQAPATKAPETQTPATKSPTTSVTEAPPKVDPDEDTGIVNTIKQLAAFIASLRAKLNLADLTPEERALIEAQIAAAEAIIAKGDAATAEEITAAYNNIVKAVESVNGGAALLKAALEEAGLTKLADKVVVTKSPKTIDELRVAVPIVMIVGAAAAVIATYKRSEEA